MEIFTHLMGVTFRPAEAKEIVKHLTKDDGELLKLEPEPDNAYDDHAVKVIYEPRGEHIGYIARSENVQLHEDLIADAEYEIEIAGFENTLKPSLIVRWEQEHSRHDDFDEDEAE